MSGGRGSSERGSATVWVLLLAVLLTVVGSGAIVIVGGFANHRRAAAAADLAALAGASRSVVGEQAACSKAETVAALNGAELLSCRIVGSSVVLVVAVDPGSRWLPTMYAAARAGSP